MSKLRNSKHNFLIVLFVLISSITSISKADRQVQGSFSQAPSFRKGLEWLNTFHPIELRDLRGKFVLLDFWTYACINCRQVISELKRLEEKYPAELVVIGVHSAKFTEERLSQNIREAIRRFDISHPVINDNQLLMWRDYGIMAWPTIILIDPLGNIIFRHSGEGVFDPVDKILQTRASAYSSELDQTPLAVFCESKPELFSGLFFPGKIIADTAGKKLFIADSGHHRIVVTDLNGNIQDIVGNGMVGREDGDFATASFSDPQGIAISGDNLYIADRANHLIRQVNLKTRQVSTIAGTGFQNYQREVFGPALQAGLNSPWDLTIISNMLYIAMAGRHQIWALDLNKNEIKVYAGSGIEGISDGALQVGALAQPSGLATDGNNLYVADSEASGIRQISVGSQGEIRTLIGKGLFEFGDFDGNFTEARLQHPLGITWFGSSLGIADTYNNKVKIIDLIAQKCTTLSGTGQEGQRDGAFLEASFNEPSGLSYGDEKIYVADTNNHLIRVLDLRKKTVSALAIQGYPPHAEKSFNPDEFNGERISIALPQPDMIRKLKLIIELPPNSKLLNGAPSRIRIFTKNGEKRHFGIKRTTNTFLLNQKFDADKLYVEANIYFCRLEKKSLCLLKNILFEMDLESSPRRKDLELTCDVKGF